jgi:NAD(P)H-flavin reductase
VKLQCSVADIVAHGSSVYTMRLRADRGLPRWKPGQFLHLALDDHDPEGGFWPDSRPFSIASSPNPGEILLSYSVRGAFTARMEKMLKLGTRVWVKMPYGSFIIEDGIKGDATAVLVAGGTGITPFTAHLERELARSPRSGNRLRMYYGARNKDLLLYKNLLLRCCKELDSFALYVSLEEAGDLGLPYRTGRLDLEEIARACVSIERAVIYVAGPPGMVDVLQSGLLALGFPMENLVRDEWV